MFRLRRHTKREILEDYDDYGSGNNRYYKRKKHFRLRYWVILVFIAAAGSFIWRSAQANENMDLEQRLDNVQAGQLLFKTDRQAVYQSSVIHNSEVHFQISGMVAHTVLKQSFRNDSADWVEGIYAFPLPETAAVNRLTMRVGDRVIRGHIKEKKEAKKVYQAAMASGRKAGLVEQERPNLFTTQIANIPPGEAITVELEYLQTVGYEHGQFSLRFPMTITPRYIPGVPLLPAKNDSESVERDQPIEERLVFDSGMGWAFNTDQVTDASRISPFLYPQIATDAKPVNPIKITANIDMGMPLNNIDSAYHNIILSRQDSHYSLRLSKGVVSMEQDFALTWLPAVGREPTAALFSETIDETEYALMMVLPPAPEKVLQKLPREVIVIIDTSGSMDGISIRQARQSLLMALDNLKPTDRFNIIEFNSRTYPLYPQAVDANASNIAHAQAYVKKIKSGGGTEMLPAIHAALKDQASESHIRQVIFITDGAVGNEAALFKDIKNNLGTSRLFTVGIGSSPNSYFMRKAAQFGRGTFTHIGDINEVHKKMLALFNKLDSPVMSNISLNWSDKTTVEVYPKKIPDLYLGEPLLISASMENTSDAVVIKGEVGGKRWEKSLQLNRTAQQRGVATLWARQKISALLDERISGRSESDVRKDVLPVALAHQLVSPYTSFVAVDDTPSRPVGADAVSKAVPNARPKGQGPQAYAYPKTATRGMQSFFLALMFGMLTWVWMICIRKEQHYDLV